jgi:N-acetylmuramoyl-L-alanine amidase
VAEPLDRVAGVLCRWFDNETFAVKLAFLEALAAAVSAHAGAPQVVMGDMNVAPADIDVYDPVLFQGATHVSSDERALLRRILDSGLVDAYRVVHPDEVGYTWWDYRQGHFQRGMGLRIDLALVAAGLAEGLRACGSTATSARARSRPTTPRFWSSSNCSRAVGKECTELELCGRSVDGVTVVGLRAWVVAVVGVAAWLAPAGSAAAVGHPERGESGLAAPPARLPAPSGLFRLFTPWTAGPAGVDYPGALWEPASPANYTVAQRPVDLPIQRIIIHVAEGGFASTYEWFRNPAAQASAHFVVGSNGEVAQMVPVHDIAWHAGNWAYNETSIGIEHAGYTGHTIFPDAQYRGSARLAAFLADRYLITPDRRHVIGHSEVPDPNHPGEWGGIDHHTDPGDTWNWPLYMAYLRADAWDTHQQIIDNSNTSRVRYNPAIWHASAARPGHMGPDYLYTPPRAESSPVYYKLDVPATDSYDVFMRWPCNPAYNRSATVGIATIAGYRVVHVNESQDCERGWNWLGSFPLSVGDSWRLIVSSRAPGAGNIAADAIRLVEASDPTPPSSPATTVTPSATSLAVSWTQSSDNVRVGGYQLWINDVKVYQGPDRTATVTGVHCGDLYLVSVRAIDMAGNRSAPHRLTVSTPACPVTPTGLAASNATQTSITLE